MQQDTSPAQPHNVSAFNALRHGLRSQATLLPGDNRAACFALRDELFHLYQPRTVDEAFCVAQMAKLQWRIRRCDRWQEIYDEQQDALLCGDPGLDNLLCEPDAHRSLHRPMDCELHAGRMDRRLCRLRARLFELQKLRRLNLIAGRTQIVDDYHELLAQEEGASTWDGEEIPEADERDANGFGSGTAQRDVPLSTTDPAANPGSRVQARVGYLLRASALPGDLTLPCRGGGFPLEPKDATD